MLGRDRRADVLARAEAAGRDGLPRLRTRSRTTGRTRATSCCRTTCSSRTRRGACPRTCFIVSGWSAKLRDERSDELSRLRCKRRDRRPTARRTRRARLRTTRGPTSPISCTSTTISWGYYVVEGLPARLRRQRDVLRARSAERKDAWDLEPAAVLRHGAEGQAAVQHPAAHDVLHGGAQAGRCRPSRGSRPRRRSASIRLRSSRAARRT